MAAALTPAIISGLGAIGITGTAAVVVASVITTVISTAIAFGLSMLLAPSQKRTQTEISQEFKQTAGPVVRHYGNVLSAIQTRIFWAHKDGILDKLGVFGSDGISAVNQVWLDGAPVTLDGSGFVTDAKYQSQTGSHVEVITTLGADDQTVIADLKARYPTLWGDDFRARGHALVYTQNRRCPSNLIPSMYPSSDAPLVAVDLNGRTCLDLRDDTTAFSANPALQIYDYLRSPHGGGLSTSDFDETEFEAAANDCDDVINLRVTGTEKRYECHLSYESTEDRSSVIARMLATCAGTIRLRPNGKVGLRVGKWRAPTVTIEEEHIIAIESAGADDKRTSYSKRISKFTDVAARFSAQTTAPWVNSTLVSSVGDVTVSKDRLEVHSHAQCARLDKAQTLFDNPDRTVTITLRFIGLLLMDEENFTLHLPDLGYTNQPMWLDSWAVSEDFTMFTITARTADATSFDWDPATEEPTQPISTTLPGQSGGVPDMDITDVDVETGTVGAQTFPIIVVTLDNEPDYEAVIQVSKQGENNWTKLTIEASGNRATFNVVDESVDYKVRAFWAVNAANVLDPGDPGTGAQDLVENVEVVANATAPAAPVILTQSTNGTVSHTVTFEPDAGANYHKTVARRTVGGAVKGTDFASGGDNSITFFLDVDTNSYELVSINPSGVESVATDLGAIAGPSGGG
jgi:hypothetical protein